MASNVEPEPDLEPEPEPTDDEFAKFIQDITEKAKKIGVDFNKLLQPHTEPKYNLTKTFSGISGYFDKNKKCFQKLLSQNEDESIITADEWLEYFDICKNISMAALSRENQIYESTLLA